MTHRKLHRAVVRRVTGYLAQGPRSRRAREWSRRRSPDDPVIFIVAERHMPYRFAPFFYVEWLDWVGEHDPALRTLIEIAYLPADLPRNTRLLHPWVQDPVRERDPAMFCHLGELQEAATLEGASVVQPVEVLSNSLREVQYEQLTRVGLRTPRVVPVGPRFAEDLGGLSLPVLVRSAWGHGGGMLRLETEEQVARWLQPESTGARRYVASEYVDVRDADGLYRKYRYVFFGERGVSRHLIVSRHWEVRPSDRVLTDHTIAEELAYVRAPCGLHNAFDAARRELGFDIAAFDYSLDANGMPVVWEVNPYPELSRPMGRPGEYLEGAIVRGHEAMAAMYRDRLEAAAR